MDAPKVQYARLNGVSLAFQTAGSEVGLLMIGGLGVAVRQDVGRIGRTGSSSHPGWSIL
jgi:hypothetical protein